MAVAILIGFIGNTLSRSGKLEVLEGSDSEKIVIRIAQYMSEHHMGLAVIAGLVFAGILACTMSRYICKGSEGYYTYTVDGSTDGINWTQLLDHTNKNSESVTKTYGFNSDMLKGRARYVRLNVRNATLQNNPDNNWYNPQVYEIRVFGTPVGAAEKAEPYKEISFDSGTGDLILGSGASVKQDPQKGSVLCLDGSDGAYAEFPAGMLDGCRDYTVSMDVKSESTGNFFTFAAGKNDEKYVFFRVAEDLFRFAATTDSWRDETEIKYDIDGSQWHNYTLVALRRVRVCISL